MSGEKFSRALCRKCLYTSLATIDMARFAQMAYPHYDIYESSGYPEGYPIPAQDAANRIVEDMLLGGRYIEFVEALIRVESIGYMGRRYELRGLKEVMDDILEKGYSFDKTTGQFFENQQIRISRNWGRLLEGDERQMTLLRLDIVSNSLLVKDNPKKLIEKAFHDLRKIVTQAVVSRLGRLWIWDGDGVIAAFMLGDHTRMAIFAGVNILNEMFFYNKFKNPLNADMNLRLSVHSGKTFYSASDVECLKSDMVKKVITLESKAAVPNSFVISDSLAVTLDQALLDIFSPQKSVRAEKYRIYSLGQSAG